MSRFLMRRKYIAENNFFVVCFHVDQPANLNSGVIHYTCKIQNQDTSIRSRLLFPFVLEIRLIYKE